VSTSVELEVLCLARYQDRLSELRSRVRDHMSFKGCKKVLRERRHEVLACAIAVCPYRYLASWCPNSSTKSPAPRIRCPDTTRSGKFKWTLPLRKRLSLWLSPATFAAPFALAFHPWPMPLVRFSPQTREACDTLTDYARDTPSLPGF
jgi:hypothetical protein